jgi:Ca2+-transporting ATPase
MNVELEMLSASKATRLSVQECQSRLKSNLETGLRQTEIVERRNYYGSNELKPDEPDPLWKRYLQQFKDPLIGLLVASAAISVVMGQYDDAVSISVALVIVVSVGFIQEHRSEKALEQLTKLIPPKARVIRSDVEQDVYAAEIVSGDIVILKAGDRVPADIRVSSSNDLLLEESSMTGETKPQRKTNKINETGNPGEQSYSNMCYMGCLVLSGTGRGIVTTVGEHSQFGEMVKLLSQEEPPRTPLQCSMDKLGQQLSLISFGVIGIIFLIGWIEGRPMLEMFTMGVSLAVAAIPEGLPIVVTVTLALGVMRMAKKQAIVRRLPAVETLGCVDVICSDKTGTLTNGVMAVTAVLLSDGSKANIGQIVTLHGEVQHGRSHPLMESLTTASVLCNNSVPTYGKRRPLGSPTESALMQFAQKLGLEDLRNDWQRIKEIPFSPETKKMAVCCIYNRDPERVKTWFVKGAPEFVLKTCFAIQTRDGRQSMTEKMRRNLLDDASYMMQQGLRVLAVGKSESREDELIFLGLIGITDPPRQSAIKAISEFRDRGIQIKMITGDAKETAIAIGSQLGMQNTQAMSGNEIDALNDTQLSMNVVASSVFYRMTPQHKLRIVKCLQQVGHTVGMCGDGVNDAVALKKADIGIAMGMNGTDVCREASDMVLLNDDLLTIIPAIEEGKAIFYNIRNFITFQLSTSVAALSLIALTTLFSLPNPLNAMQVLWINILMDGPPAQSLGVEPADRDLVKGKPRPRELKLLNRGLTVRVCINAFLILCGTFYILTRELADGKLTNRERTMTFTCFVLFDMMNALACRSQRKSITQLAHNFTLYTAIGLSLLGQLLVIYWSPLQNVFQTEPLSFGDIFLLSCIASSVLIVSEILKYFKRKKAKETEKFGIKSHIQV